MMKKTLFLLILLLGCRLSLPAQDLIVKTDDTKIEAKVTEIAPDAVRYKRFSNPDGPTYVLPVVQIAYIRYANGDVDRFSAPAEPVQSAEPAEPALPAVPVQPAQPADGAKEDAPAAVPAVPSAPAAPQPVYVIREYAIGEFYDQNGVRGVVCDLTPDRQHGLILSLDEATLQWSTFRKPDLRQIGADDTADGEKNMAAVAAYIEANGLSWEEFPAFAWCRDHGEGWYFPSIDEMLRIGHNYNGGTRMRNDRAARNRFNEALKGHGGERMDRIMYYFTSTEADEKEALTTHTSLDPPYMNPIPKSNRFLVRAVHRF